MSATVYLVNDLPVIAVSWHHANDLYDYLRRNGIRAAMHLNQAGRSVEIEPVEGTDTDRIGFLVARWRDRYLLSP
jgi:hypothetical protein